jgi:P-type Ca2+ transporter type 2C
VGTGPPDLPDSSAYRWTSADLAAALGTDIARGLSDEEARARLDQYGRNELTAAQPVPRWRRFLEQFQDWRMSAAQSMPCNGTAPWSP